MKDPLLTPSSSLPAWLERFIVSSAESLETAQKGSYQFAQKIAELLGELPLQEWEADRWMRGVKLKLIKLEEYFFRAGAGKNAALSLFVRNEEGLNVGLRREAVTQMATYVSLITDYGFGRKRTKFESRRMDVAVDDDQGNAVIYAENKASEKVLQKLCARLETEFKTTIPVIPEQEDGKRVADDGLMKASHIWSHRPQFFWGVCPTHRQAYRVEYNYAGFTLSALEDIPNVDQIDFAPQRIF